jgi:hypothetical protein
VSKGTVIFAFLAGTAVGSVVTWKVLKDKYEQLAREEIQEVYSRTSKLKKVLKDVDEIHEVEEAEYKQAVRDYTSFSSATPKPCPKPENGKEDEPMPKPYVVTPEEFGDIDEYETKSLIYWADGVLTDDSHGIIDDVESLVTEDSLTHFGEYEDDSVFVRNDDQQVDYEILYDTRRYEDVHPHHVEE